jgi:hypothetical protein
VAADEGRPEGLEQAQSESPGAEERLAAALARGVSRTLGAHGGATLTEFTLRTGRRVDVIGVDDRGEITIVEIKTSVADFRSDGKWPEYLDFCDYFYFAVPEDFPRELLPDDCGVMVADAYEALILVPSEARPVNGSRRRALILRFARAAAQRLNAYTDPRD